MSAYTMGLYILGEVLLKTNQVRFCDLGMCEAQAWPSETPAQANRQPTDSDRLPSFHIELR